MSAIEINTPLVKEIKTMNYQELDNEFVANTYGRFDVCFVKGEGSVVYDEKGKEYIDLGSGIGVTAFGIHDDVWANAVINQVKSLNHVSNLYYTLPQMELAQKLCEKTGMKKVFFSNSGAEANECAIKTARKYSSDKYGGDRNVIITLVNSFHGRTITTLSATGQDVFHQHFGPFTEGFIFTPANDLDAFYEVAKNPRVCAVLIETIQGEGGVMPLEADFVQGIAQAAQLRQGKHPANQRHNQIHQHRNRADKQNKAAVLSVIFHAQRGFGDYGIDKRGDKAGDGGTRVVIGHHQNHSARSRAVGRR